jgi:hypothetical protein
VAPTITRTPIIDDNGTLTTGTPIDNAFKQELYDQIDALSASLAAARRSCRRRRPPARRTTSR